MPETLEIVDTYFKIDLPEAPDGVEKEKSDLQFRAKCLGIELPAEIEDVGQVAALVSSTAKNWFTIRRLLKIPSTSKLTAKEITSKLSTAVENEETGENAYKTFAEILGIELDDNIKEKIIFEDSGIIDRKHITDLIHYIENQHSEEEEEEEPGADGAINSDYGEDKIEDLVHKILQGRIVLDPPWQRGNVWKTAEKRKLVQSILRGIPVPTLLFLSTDDGPIYVLDGKQRLTSIYEYMVDFGYTTSNNWSNQMLGKGAVFNLGQCRNKKFNELMEEAKRVFKNTKLSYIEIKNISRETTVELFNLYNSTGQALKPVELRNALYHQNPIHKMLFEITGEAEIQQFNYLQEDETNIVKSKLQDFKMGVRFETLELAEKYLGYRRAFSDGVFKPVTAEKGVYNYWDYLSPDEDPNDVANEILNAVLYQNFLFDQGFNGWKPKDSGGWELKKTQSKMIVSLIISSIACDLENAEVIDANTMKEIIDVMDASSSKDEYGLPARDNSNTLWDYQARWVIGFLNKVSAKTGIKIEDMRINHDFVNSMKIALL